MKIVIVLLIIAYLVSPFLRCFTANIFRTLYMSINDLYDYVVHRKWRDWSWVGIYNFCGYFGKGKTLSATAFCLHIVNRMKRYHKKVRVVSNYHINGIDYIPLTNFDQIVEIGKVALEGKDNYAGTIVLIDEVEMLLSHRKFATFPISLLSTLCQQRKAHICVLATAQRFHMIDKCFRDISAWVVDCTKFWRFERLRYFDAWDVENATQTNMVACKKTQWFFVTNEHYNAYDTSKMITQASADDFISNDEQLMRRGVESIRNNEMVKHPSKRLVKKQRTK